jgi:hypothetical protein
VGESGIRVVFPLEEIRDKITEADIGIRPDVRRDEAKAVWIESDRRIEA